MSATPQDDPLDFEGKEEAERRRDEMAKVAIFDAAEDLKWLMGTLRGRRFVWKILDDSGLRKEPMTGNSSTFYNLGKLAIGRDLEARIFSVCPEQYVVMIEENGK